MIAILNNSEQWTNEDLLRFERFYFRDAPLKIYTEEEKKEFKKNLPPSCVAGFYLKEIPIIISKFEEWEITPVNKSISVVGKGKTFDSAVADLISRLKIIAADPAFGEAEKIWAKEVELLFIFEINHIKYFSRSCFFKKQKR